MHFEKRGSTSISVAENEHYRWMTINDAVQSVMSLTQKELPVLPHLSAMLMSLYYLPEPMNILELGLGGGSMQRFFRHYFPQSHITTAENNDAVIRLFNDWFRVTNQTYDIKNDDARKILRNATPQDMLIIDLFSNSGSPNFLNEATFYQLCLDALAENGLIVMNLIVQYQLQVNLVEDMLKECGLKVRLFSVPGFQNRVLIASRQSLSKVRYSHQLEMLANQYNIDLNSVVAN